MMTTSWHAVIIYLHLSPKVEPCQECLAQSSAGKLCYVQAVSWTLFHWSLTTIQ